MLLRIKINLFNFYMLLDIVFDFSFFFTRIKKEKGR